MGRFRSRSTTAVVLAMKLRRATVIDTGDGYPPIAGAAGSWIVLHDGSVDIVRDSAFVDEYVRVP